MTERSLSDKEALDEIAKILSGEEWSPDHLDWIADVVHRSGRELMDIDEDPDDE